jgi:hypothetical protein
MNSQMHVELSDRQRELLLRGLRFVRSSRMLEFRESSDLSDDQRREELQQIRQLSELLQNSSTSNQPAHV